MLAAARGPWDAAPLATISVGRDGVIQAWNAAAERLLGWRDEDVVGRTVAAVLEDEHGQPLVPNLNEQPLNGAELRVRTRTGSMVDVAVWTGKVGDGGGSRGGGGHVVMLVDISEHRRRWRDATERAESQTLLRQLTFLAEASADLSSSLDLEATLQRAASVAVPELADLCSLHLLQPDGTIAPAGIAVADPVLHDTLAELQRRYPPTHDGLTPSARALRTGRSMLVADVSHRWLSSVANDADHLQLMRRLAPRSLMGVPLVARDRTIGAITLASTNPNRRYDDASLAMAEALARRSALAIDNARLHAQTRDALRAREAFLSVASHELGGPLARLKLYTEVLQLAASRRDLNDALLGRALSSIQRASNRLAGITQDLLDVARWQTGELSLTPKRLDFGKLAREVVRSAQDHTGRRVALKISRGRYMIVGDAGRLEQVLENLLDNALKYSPDGSEVFVDVRPEAGGVLLRVRDQGIGIPEGATTRIFEPFERAPNAESRSVPGMGLGLHICRSIVERHGGRVWAESKGEHQGTTMIVWLPGPRA